MERQQFGAPKGQWVVWTTPQCLVVPRSLANRANFEAARTELRRAGWPIHVRSSGGSVVPLGPGIINVTLARPPSPEVATIAMAYEHLCAPLLSWLEELGEPGAFGAVPGSFCDGSHNVIVRGLKVAGTAQRRGRSGVLMHLSLTVNADLEAGVEAVRKFNRALNHQEHVSAGSHLNLAEIIPCTPETVGRELLLRV